MNKLLLLIPLVLFFVCVAFLIDFWIKLYDLTTIPVTALTMAQGFQILSLALWIGVLTMLLLAFLFVLIEMWVKKL
jgi:hypothetical protein